MEILKSLDYQKISRSRYTSQFDVDPVYDAIVQTLVEYKSKLQENYIDFAKKILDVDIAEGGNLDLCGAIVGQPRTLVEYYSKPYFGFYGNPKAEPLDKGLWFSKMGGVGSESRVMTDEEYRRVIKARIIANRTSCNRQDFIDVIKLLIDGNDFRIETLAHGDITLRLKEEQMTEMVSYFLSRTEGLDSLIPKPLGYRLKVVYGEI